MALQNKTKRFSPSFSKRCLRIQEMVVLGFHNSLLMIDGDSRLAFLMLKQVFLCRAEEKVTVHFLNRDGKRITVKASAGESLLDVVVDRDLDIDGFGKLLKNSVKAEVYVVQKLQIDLDTI